MWHSPWVVQKRMTRAPGDHWTLASCKLSSFPQSLFPSTLPTMTAPSSYTMQIFCPSAVHFISLTKLLFLLLIISSNHMPLWSIQTMIRPLWSLVVSFL